MINYIRADLRRAFRRIPRLVVLALIYVLVTIAFVEIFNAGSKISFLMIAYEHYIVGFIPLVVGLVELAVILSDDLRAKTMQSAIGMGIGRRKVVLVKLADLAILMFVDLLLFGLIVALAGRIWNMGLTGAILGQFALTLLVAWIKYVAYTSLVLILAFYSQNVLFAILVHIGLASGLAYRFLNMGLQVKLLAPLHLERYLLTAQANAFYTQMLLGRFQVGALLAVAVYIVGGFLITSYLYSSIELEL